MSDSKFRQLMTRAGIFTGKTTRPEDFRRLVTDLRVIPTQHELIRVGPDGDGGYVIPDDLHGVTHCFSPGVSDCSDFEVDLAERGMEVFLADRSVDGPAVCHHRFHFVKKFVSSSEAPERGLTTLDQWYRDCLGDPRAEGPDAILQMDIEGCEYEVLHSAPETLLSRFRVVIIEFHRLHQLLDRHSFSWMSGAFQKLLRSHAVVHLHPNNARRTIHYRGIELPFTMEFTFLRRDRLRACQRTLQFPHPLDRKNVATRPDLILPRCWAA